MLLSPFDKQDMIELGSRLLCPGRLTTRIYSLSTLSCSLPWLISWRDWRRVAWSFVGITTLFPHKREFPSTPSSCSLNLNGFNSLGTSTAQPDW